MIVIFLLWSGWLRDFLHLLEDLRLEVILIVKNCLLHLLLARVKLTNKLFDRILQVIDHFLRPIHWRLGLLLQRLHFTLKCALELMLGSLELLELAHEIILDRLNLSSRLSVALDCLLKRLLTLFQPLN